MKNFIHKLFTILLKIIIILVKTSICLIVTLFAGYFAVLVSVISYTSKDVFDWQILLYIIYSIFIIFEVWVISFIKTKNIIKWIYWALLIFWLFMPKILPSVMAKFDFDTCIDTGICSEGVKFKNHVITKEYCIQNNYKWDEKSKSCNFRK